MIREADVDGDGQINYEGESDVITRPTMVMLIFPAEFVKVCRVTGQNPKAPLTARSADDAFEVKDCAVCPSTTCSSVRYLFLVSTPRPAYTSSEVSKCNDYSSFCAYVALLSYANSLVCFARHAGDRSSHLQSRSGDDRARSGAATS